MGRTTLKDDQPFQNHNSGPVLFGPDGYLYVTVGDGGSGGDPQGNGQNLGVLLGKILRLDVSRAPYTVPPDNPFVATEGARPEIWAYGVRNPWGARFDGDTLWFADVGQNQWEEVNVGVKGGNYGWNRMEGTHCFKGVVCDQSGLVVPVAEYGHDVGQSVTGGAVYRGPSIPALDGRYVYADFASGVMFAVRQRAACTGWANSTSVIESAANDASTATATGPGTPSNHSVGMTMFHTPGNPRNQWSGVIMSFLLNHIADVVRIIAMVSSPTRLCGSTRNCQANVAGTSTQVT
jgi:hypothetical protein